ncbi:sugar phosphate isomerase/epimerase family protein [Brachybacterium saurashtrense]|uniref:Sugar phosphate isomerase/epimerase n=1 Tax=Brachybacterium saurashtrense TaxID=556288 RepID=A0A345YRJ5_9MICO|nr:TIM barrel protein [Brachybacterium saurashtrense]AXK46547.1 sugar phosphate isomerase/epimerase [Brachybacterium saurashtrense]RRR24288.1 sugar phosphate isomerase/epimerase [Brachybacterium saurashtrense]
MTLALDPTQALHTWSLFRTMGRYVAPGSAPSGALAENTDGGGLGLLELPAQLASHGFTSAQLCHFYLPTTEASYLAELRAAFETASVDLEVLLVDDGDVVHPEHGREQQRWLATWLDVAEQLGAPRVRVPAGDQPPSADTLALSAGRLRELAAAHPALRVLTENWRGLLVDEVATTRLLDLLEGEVGLLIDTGNWDGEDRYRQIAAVAGQAECSQVKARESAPGVLDEEDLEQSLRALAEAGYAGRLSLVYAGSDDDEWGRLAQMQGVVRRVLA